MLFRSGEQNPCPYSQMLYISAISGSITISLHNLPPLENSTPYRSHSVRSILSGCLETVNCRKELSQRSNLTLLFLITIILDYRCIQQHSIRLILRLDEYSCFIPITYCVSPACQYGAQQHDAIPAHTLMIWPVQKPVPLSNQSLSRNS